MFWGMYSFHNESQQFLSVSFSTVMLLLHLEQFTHSCQNFTAHVWLSWHNKTLSFVWHLPSHLILEFPILKLHTRVLMHTLCWVGRVKATCDSLQKHAAPASFFFSHLSHEPHTVDPIICVEREKAMGKGCMSNKHCNPQQRNPSHMSLGDAKPNGMGWMWSETTLLIHALQTPFLPCELLGSNKIYVDMH